MTIQKLYLAIILIFSAQQASANQKVCGKSLLSLIEAQEKANVAYRIRELELKLNKTFAVTEEISVAKTSMGTEWKACRSWKEESAHLVLENAQRTCATTGLDTAMRMQHLGKKLLKKGQILAGDKEVYLNRELFVATDTYDSVTLYHNYLCLSPESKSVKAASIRKCGKYHPDYKLALKDASRNVPGLFESFTSIPLTMDVFAKTDSEGEAVFWKVCLARN